MFLLDVLEKLQEGTLSKAELQSLEREVHAKFDQCVDTITHFMHSKGKYYRYLRVIKKAYRNHPNALVENLEQLSQLYDQINVVDTLGTPISFLMQNMKTILPTYFFADADEQARTRQAMPDFFEDLDESAADEKSPGIELYPSWVLARWINEETPVCASLNPDLEKMFSSYCLLFLDSTVKQLGLNIPARVLLSLIQGPECPTTARETTFLDIVGIELKLWEEILRNLLSANKYYLKNTKLQKFENIDETDAGRALKYLTIPEKARAAFDRLGIKVHEFYIVEVCADIIAEITRIADEGFTSEERAKLRGILKNAPEDL